MFCFWFFSLASAALLFPASEGALSNIDGYNIKGRHFIIATSHHNPYMLVEHSGGKISSVDGFVHQIVAWMAEKYDFTFEYVEPIDGAYGTLFANRSWNGMIGMLVRGEVDMIAADLSLTYPRFLAVDFTFPFIEEPVFMLIPYPKLSSTITGIAKPFQWEVWLGLIVSLTAVAVSLWLVSLIQTRIVPQPSHENTGWFSHFWFLFRVVVNSNESFVSTLTLATRFVVAAWCLAAIVFVNSYTSSLLSYLMAPKFVPLINSVQDLADSKDISIVVTKYTSVHSTLIDATSGPLAKIGDSIRAHPEYLIPNIDDHIGEIISEHHKALPENEIAAKLIIYEDFKATNQCRLFLAKEPFALADPLAFAIAKNSLLTNIYNKELIKMREFGLLNHWKSSFLPKPHRCSAPPSSTAQPNTKLNLNYLSSAFLLYGVGVVASVVAFICELFTSWVMKRKNEQAQG